MDATSSPLVLEDDRLYTPQETAAILRLTVRQVARARQAKKLLAVRFTGSAVRHAGWQIRKFIEDSSTGAARS